MSFIAVTPEPVPTRVVLRKVRSYNGYFVSHPEFPFIPVRPDLSCNPEQGSSYGPGYPYVKKL